jgi:hypothetical protein
MSKKVTIFISLSAMLGLFVVAPVVATSGPNSCVIYGNNANTSSDGSMFVRAVAQICNTTPVGSMSWEAYTGEAYYVTNEQATVCGNSQTASGNSYDLIVGQAAYATTCSYYIGQNYATGQLMSYTFPTGSTSVTVSVEGWSGNCSSIGPSSPCTTSTSASAP